MSDTIDQKVVSMQFDNANFERNVKTSMSTLDKLKKSLKLDGVSKGLENVNKTAKETNFSVMSKGADAVKMKISAMQVLTLTALHRISNSAITTGETMVKAFTIDPVKSGLQEYETQINAVQTILANTKNKGSTLDDVNSALDELNTYADKTIYNFTEMTRNIGTFTAAGVGLKESTQAIKGIANLAAVSGSNAQQASTAMYQLSQALAAGKVTLMDWNSVVNAGMGGEVFQTALKRTARVMGTGVDEAIEKYGTFRESLTQGAWLTTDVLTETLSQLSGAYDEADLISQGYTKKQAKEIADMAENAVGAATNVKTFTQLLDTLKEAAQSGWTQTWELIIGDFEEAKALFTDLSTTFGNLIGQSADARNSVLQGAMQNFVNKDDWNGLKEAGVLTKGFKESLIETAESHGVQIRKMIKDENGFTKTLKNGWLNKEILQDSIKHLSDEQLKADGLTKKQIKSLKQLAGTAKETGTPLNELVKSLQKPSGRELLIDALNNSVKAIIKPFAAFKDAWHDVFGTIQSKNVYNLVKGLDDFTKKVLKVDEDGSKMRKTFRGIFSILKLVTTVIGGGFKIAVTIVDNVLSHFNLNILDATAAIGDAIYRFTEWITKNSFLVKALKAGMDTISNFIVSVYKSGKAFADNSKIITKGKALVLDLVDALSNLDKISVDSVIGVFEKFGKRISDYFSFANENVKKGITGMIANLLSFKTKAGETATSIGDKIKNSIGPILTILTGIMLIKTIKTLSDAFYKFANGPIELFKTAMIQLGSTLKAYQMKLKSEALLNIAAAIAILAGSLFILTKVDQTKLATSAVALGSMVVGLTGLCFVLGKFDALDIGKVSLSLVAISGSLLILVVALKKMEGLDSNKILMDCGLLAGLAAALLLFGGISGKIKGFNAGLGSVIAFAVALRLMVNTLAALDKLNLKNISKDLILLFGIIKTLGFMSRTTKGIKFSSAAGLVSVAISLRIFIKALNEMSAYNFEKMKNNMSGIAVILGIFSGLIILSKVAGANSAKAGGMILAISIAMRMMITTIKKISTLSASDVGNAVAAISGMMLVIGLIIAMSKNAGANALKAGGMILMISGAFLALTVVIAILSKLDPSGLARGTAAVSAIMLCFSVLVAATRNVQDCKANLIVMAATLGILSVALGALSFIDPSKLAKATLALSSVMGMYALMIASTKLAKNATVSLLVMTGVITILAVIISKIAALPMTNAIAASASISVLLLSMSASMAIVSLVGTKALAGMPALYALSGVVAILAVIMGAMIKLNVAPTIEIALSLSTLILALSGACAILTVAGAAAPAALIGIGVLAALIVALTTLVVSIGALSEYFPSMEGFIDTGIDLLVKLGNGIGRVIGVFIGGIGEGITSTLPTMADDLSNFMNHLQPFLDSVGGVDPKIASSAKTLATAMLAITGAQLVDSIASFAESIIGSEDMDDFGTKMAAFGDGIVSFSKSVSGNIDSESVNTATNAGKMLVEIANAIPNSGGLLGKIFGNNDMDDFGNMMKTFGKGIVSFSDTVKGKIDTKAVETATNAGKMLTEIAKAVPNSGGILGEIMGDNDIDDFGVMMGGFGRGLVNFSDTVKGKINKKAIESATNAGKMLTEVAKAIPNSGGKLQEFLGDKDIDKFGDKLSNFGKGLASMCNGPLSEISKKKSDKIKSNIKNVFAAINEIDTSKSGKIDQVSTSLKDLSKASISGFAKGFDNDKTATVSINAFLNNAIKTITDAKSRFIAAGITVANGCISGINSTKVFFTSSGKNCVDGLITGITSKLSDAHDAGYRIGKNALDGSNKALDIHSPSKKMKKVGEYTVAGFVNELKNKGTVNVKKASVKLMKTFTDTVSNASNIKDYAGGIIANFTKSYADSTQKISKQKKLATSAIGEYIKKLYKESDAYKQDQSTLNTHMKELKKYYNERKKLIKDASKQEVKDQEDKNKKLNQLRKELRESEAEDAKQNSAKNTNQSSSSDADSKAINALMEKIQNKRNEQTASVFGWRKTQLGKEIAGLEKQLKQLKGTTKDTTNTASKGTKEVSERTKSLRKEIAKAEKENSKGTSDSSKNLKKSLKENDKNIKKAKEQIKKDQKQMVKNAKAALKEVKNSIKESVKEYVDIFNASADEIDLFDTSALDNIASSGIGSAISDISSSLKSFISIFNIGLDAGVSMFDKFSTEAEDTANAVKDAESNLKTASDDLTQAQNDLTKAQEELTAAREKSNSVNGRSQKYLDQITEAEQRVAEATDNLTSATEAQTNAQKQLDDLNNDNSTSEILENMKSNVDGVKELENNLKTLAERGLNDGLLKSLKELGTSGAKQIATFVKMSDKEISQANDIFAEYGSISADKLIDGFTSKKKEMVAWGESIKKFSALNINDTVKATLLEEFQSQGIDSADYINAILAMPEEQLRKFSDEYLSLLSIPDEVADVVIKAQNKVDESSKSDSNTADNYLNTMEANVKAAEAYENSLKKLKSRGISDEFYAHLKGLGKDGADIVASFADASDEQLKKGEELFTKSAQVNGQSYIDAYGDSISDVKRWQANMEKLSKLDIPQKTLEAMMKDFQEKGVDGNGLLEMVLSFTPEQLNSYADKYAEAMKLPSQTANSVVSSLASTDKEVQAMIKASSESAKETSKKEGEKAAKAAINGANKELKNGKSKLKKTGKETAKAAINGLKDHLNTRNGKTVGTEVCSGMVNGLKNNSNKVKNAAETVAEKAYIAAKKKLGIKSPSRKFAELGMYSCLGFSKGLSNYSKNVEESSAELGNNALSSISNAISEISSLAIDEMDTNPTIKPVIDMSQVQKDAKDLNKLMALDSVISTSAGMASNISTRMNRTSGSQNGSTNMSNSYDNSTYSTVNNFNISGDNPKEIANEVSRILQKQINRRSAAWV